MQQHYGAGGVPVEVEGDVADPARAWESHRARLRDWLDALPDDEWSAPTRCPAWDVSGVVRHLVSTSQFLGFTLHRASQGIATELMRGFDPQRFPRAATAPYDDLAPSGIREALGGMDERVRATMEALPRWDMTAEAPPGHVPAHLAVSHMLFDSWVHEHDVLRPRGETPVVDRRETEVVVRYLMALAAAATGSRVSLDVRLTDPDLRIGVDPSGPTILVTVGSAPFGAAVVEGPAAEVVDLTTGRETSVPRGDARGLDALRQLARIMA